MSLTPIQRGACLHENDASEWGDLHPSIETELDEEQRLPNQVPLSALGWRNHS